METTTPDIDTARAVLAAQPFSVLLGTRLVRFAATGTTLELDVRAQLRQQHGHVHGGVLAYLVDNALTFAGGAALGADVVTGGITVDYLQPASGEVLRATAVLVRSGSMQAVLRCDVLDVRADGSPARCAVGQGRVHRRQRRG